MIVSPMHGPAARQDSLHWTLLALFTVFLVAVNVTYSLANTRPPTYDDAWYLETSLHFYRSLTEGGVRAFLSSYAGSFGTKAPLISVLPLPFYLLLGTGYAKALLVNSLFIVISNVYLFLLARRLFTADIALAAVVFYQTMPLAYGLSRVFFPDYGLAALVVAWLYYLVASEDLSLGPANVALGVVLGLGLLMKVLFPAFVAGPLVVTLLRRQQGLPLARPLVTVMGIGLAVAATWYGFHLGAILRYAWQGSYGEIGVQYGYGGLRHWIYQFINEGISFYYIAALVMAGLAVLFWGRQGGTPGAASLLLSWLLPPLVALAAGRNREIRFVVPLLPVFAMGLAAAIFRLGRRRGLQAALAALLVVFPLRLFAALSFHPTGSAQYHPGHPVRLGGFVVFSRDLGWARPPDARGHWGQERLLEAIERLAPPARQLRYAVLGIEHPYLNANLLSYLNAYTNYPWRFTSLGYAESSVEKAVERLYSLDAAFLIMGEGFHNTDLPDFLNQVNGEIQARLDHGQLPFRLRAKVPLTDRIKAVIYERDAPWVRFAPGAEAEAPPHPLAVDFAGGARFLGYDWKPRNQYLYEMSHYWTVPHRVDEDYQVCVEFRRGAHSIRTERYFIAGGQHPFFDWQPGETVKQTVLVYLPPEAAGALEAFLWLSAWGASHRQQILLPHEYVHDSVVPLRLEPK